MLEFRSTAFLTLIQHEKFRTNQAADSLLLADFFVVGIAGKVENLLHPKVYGVASLSTEEADALYAELGLARAPIPAQPHHPALSDQLHGGV